MRILLALLFAFLLVAENPVNLDELEEVRIDDNDEFVLRTEVFFQDLRLPAGLYSYSFRSDGRRHVVILRTSRIEVRLQCEMQTLPKKARRTAIYLSTTPEGQKHLVGFTMKDRDWFCRFTL